MFASLKKYTALAKDALLEEKKQAGTKRTYGVDADFLPAAIEVMERPASPIGRGMIWLLILVFVTALIWASLAQVDTVATAHGKIALRSNSKAIQAAELGVVRAIHVQNGSRVKKGDILLELDPTVSGAEVEQAKQNLQAAQVAYRRADTLYTYIMQGRFDAEALTGASSTEEMIERALLSSRMAEYEAKQETLLQQKQELISELNSVSMEIRKLEETLPLLEEQMAARKELMEKGLSPKLLYLELQERHVNHTRNIEIQREQYTKASASLRAIEGSLSGHKEEFRLRVATEWSEAQDKVKLYSEELNKALRRNSLQSLTSPVDGVVQQLAVHTVGGVVQPAEALMVVVPGEGDMIADALVLNRDIGAIQIGDKVEVKLEAFPFTKFGVIEGTLENVSLDAIQDENLGLVYAARVALSRDTIKSNGVDIRLSPGMSLTAEIKTGRRRVIEFILNPLLRYRDEAMRER